MMKCCTRCKHTQSMYNPGNGLVGQHVVLDVNRDPDFQMETCAARRTFFGIGWKDILVIVE